MSLITIDATKCNHDGLCVQACPTFLITMEKGALPQAVTDAETRCNRCGHCVAVCPTQALENALVAHKDFLPLPAERPGPDEVEALLLSRRSIRWFKNAPVPREQLERLLDVARHAPTASNSQQLSWVMIRDAERLARVKELTEEWMATIPRMKVYAEGMKQGRDMVLRGAPVLAVAHTPSDYSWCNTDCAIALTYMELMAASMGMGACWGGLVTAASWQNPELAEIMGVPEGWKVGGALMLGLPRQKHLLVPPRNPVQADWL
jgi:nitroreductase/NAD-dependent dihydropyrimidine dehydrogenase PreA subunit